MILVPMSRVCDSEHRLDIFQRSIMEKVDILHFWASDLHNYPVMSFTISDISKHHNESLLIYSERKSAEQQRLNNWHNTGDFLKSNFCEKRRWPFPKETLMTLYSFNADPRTQRLSFSDKWLLYYRKTQRKCVHQCGEHHILIMRGSFIMV